MHPPALNYSVAPAGGGGGPHCFQAPASAAGRRLDQTLAELLPEHSRTRLRGWIEAGLVRVDDAVVTTPRHKLAGGETLAVEEGSAGADVRAVAQDIALNVVFEDDALLVVDKPAGLVVHPGAGNWAGTLANALLHHAPQQSSVPRAGIVHRLDKDTSGLMVVAKTLPSHTALVRQLQARAVTREYVALATGDLLRGDTIDAPIGRHPTRRTSMAVVATGKSARTHFDVLERFGNATLLRCRLETGRTHQIRVHLASLGHPLVGDPAYGRKGAIAFGRQALHAARLALVHPVSARKMSWDSALPRDFADLLASLRAEAR